MSQAAHHAGRDESRAVFRACLHPDGAGKGRQANASPFVPVGSKTEKDCEKAGKKGLLIEVDAGFLIPDAWTPGQFFEAELVQVFFSAILQQEWTKIFPGGVGSGDI